MTRRIWCGFALGVLLALASAGRPREEGFVVIVHPSNQFDSLSRSKLSFLFLRKVSRWPWGAEVQPIDLASGSTAHAFAWQVMRTTEEQLAEYWIDQKATRGVNPPVRVADAKAAKALVAARPGAVGYIPASELDGTVKAIKVDP